MFKGNENIRTIVGQMRRSPEGVLCLLSAPYCACLLIANAAWPFVFNLQSSELIWKWIGIWLMTPFLLFLIHIRASQLFDFAGWLGILLRVVILLVPLGFFTWSNFRE